MGKSAKFFKRPTRKEKAVLSLTKGTETSLFDSATSSETGRKGSHKKDILSATANPTISKKNSSSAAGAGASAAHPPKASLAYKMQLNGGIKAAVKDLKQLDEDDLVSEDEDMDGDDGEDTPAAQKSNKKKQDLDKSKPRPDYVELMYGKPGGNKRKTFMPKPALIK
ncbi:hypothetical protein BGW39_005425 [Mortierella sp. 14UC]|nr:hypothetical protein BGW39_005425 [Mortierella sp. 14UC]